MKCLDMISPHVALSTDFINEPCDKSRDGHAHFIHVRIVSATLLVQTVTLCNTTNTHAQSYIQGQCRNTGRQTFFSFFQVFLVVLSPLIYFLDFFCTCVQYNTIQYDTMQESDMRKTKMPPVSVKELHDTHLTATFPEEPGYASTRKVEPLWILMKQEMMRWQWHQLDYMQII